MWLVWLWDKLIWLNWRPQETRKRKLIFNYIVSHFALCNVPMSFGRRKQLNRDFAHFLCSWLVRILWSLYFCRRRPRTVPTDNILGGCGVNCPGSTTYYYTHLVGCSIGAYLSIAYNYHFGYLSSSVMIQFTQGWVFRIINWWSNNFDGIPTWL